jgi:hypothetical protein
VFAFHQQGTLGETGMTFVSHWIESYFDEQYHYLWRRIRKRPKDMSCPVSPLLPTNSRIRVRYGDIPAQGDATAESVPRILHVPVNCIERQLCGLPCPWSTPLQDCATGNDIDQSRFFRQIVDSSLALLHTARPGGYPYFFNQHAQE